MENIKDKISKMKKTSEYTFKENVVKSILEEFKKSFSKNSFNKAIEIDKKHHPIYIEFEKMINIIDELSKSKFNVKFTPEQILDGYGNIVVSFNGNPYITLTLALMAIRTHNNIVFFSKKYYAVNSLIIETINKACKKLKYVDEIGAVEYGTIEEIILNQSVFDYMIYIGDKREYQNIKKKIRIPTIFNNYNYVDVFVEDKSFKDLLLDINKYASHNDIEINYFDNTSYDETLMFINKYEISDCFVLFSKNTELIYKFMSQLKVNKFFINQNPFENYNFDFDEKNLVYNKKIFLKKV